ncbi:MAG TPA: IPTL-CTERM sorting domain-containing protein [Thermoanaerobaculia bacterium]|nr:IPTL-CTERM sorting domain-containing protein [Thermoanaerobaculia bacterium]
MSTASRRNRRRRKITAGAAVALGAVMTPEAMGAVINVNSTADNMTVDGACTLREAITNANDDAATSTDCTAGSGLDTIDFTALTLPATITLGGTSIEITDSVVIDGTSQTQLTIDGADSSRIFTIIDGDSGTHFNVAIDDLTLTNGNSGPESIPLGGGAIFAAENLTLTNVTISGNDSPDVQSGGGVLLIGLGSGGGTLPLLTLQNTTLTGNSASCCGGAISTLYANVSISNSTIDNNYAPTGGGAAIAVAQSVLIDETTITGNTAGDEGGGLYLYGAGAVTIEESVISGNEAGDDGGGVMISYSGPVEIRDTTISGNEAGDGSGGLYLYANGNVLMERVRVTNNTAGLYAGGIGLWGTQATIVESQITGNQAASTGGLYAGYGAYLYMVNTTVANNTATTGSVGGIHINNSFAAIDVSTISGNTAPAGAAGNIFSYGSSLYVSHSIIANGSALAGNDLVASGPTTVLNYTLLEDPTGATFTGANNITGVDPQLGPLQNNGGPTETMKPALTSPAVNAGSPEFTTPTNDQRGFTRPVGIVDLGAVELNPGTLALSSNAYPTSEGAGFVTITVNRTGGSDGAVSVNYSTSNGTATAGADYTTTGGTLHWADGDATPKTFDVPILDDAIFEGAETFNVTLDTVVGATLGTSAAVVTIADNESAPTIAINDPSVTEGNAGNTPAGFVVTLSHPTTQTVTVDYGTADNGATAGVDYVQTNGTITFNPLVTAQALFVQVIGDTLDEASEQFNVLLTNATNATISDATGVGTINDDDAPPAISISDVTQIETDAGTTAFAFNVTLSTASTLPITVDYATAGIEATSGTDFLPASGTLTFDPGVTSQPVVVQVIGDTLDESNETFSVSLANPTNATIDDGAGIGTITDDDGTPTLSISDVTQAEGNAGTTNFVFTVSLAPASGQTVTVDYATSGLEATSGVDFQPASGTLTFNPGVTTQQITVQVAGDTLDEANERFNVILANPNANATIADNTGLGTINDDDTSSIVINDVTLAEGNAGTTSFVFDVTITPASEQTITVDYATQNGTAIAGSDFTATSGTLTFTPGSITRQITVPVIGDTTLEPDETFAVVLSNAPLATLADNSGTGTILTDDLVADLGVAKAVVGTGPFLAGQNASFTITVTNAGPGSAANVHVVDILPAGTTFVSATPSAGTCTGTVTVDCSVGMLANGGSATITLTVQLTTAGEITNTATATSESVDPTPAAGSATITVSAAPAGAAVPTLSEWMLIALASALAAAAALKLRP